MCLRGCVCVSVCVRACSFSCVSWYSYSCVCEWLFVRVRVWRQTVTSFKTLSKHVLFYYIFLACDAVSTFYSRQVQPDRGMGLKSQTKTSKRRREVQRKRWPVRRGGRIGGREGGGEGRESKRETRKSMNRDEIGSVMPCVLQSQTY